MLELTFGEQVKIILSRKGMTIKELAERIEKQTGKKMSRQNLTQRLGRDNFQEQDMRMIAKILECPFYLDILEEHEDREEKTVKVQKTTEPEQKTKNTAAEERDITIGELVDIHKELDAIEKKKSKKKSKKVVDPDPEYVQETIFDFVRDKEAVEEPAVEEPAEEEPEELAIEIEEAPVAEEEISVAEEEPAVEEPAQETEPEYAEEPADREEPEYAEEAADKEESEYAEEPAYEEMTGYTEESVYEEEPVYEEAPEYTEEPVYEEEPEYAEEPVYEEEPEYAEEPAYEEPAEYVEEPAYEPETEYEEEPAVEEKTEEIVKEEPKKAEPEKKAHGWRALFGIRKKHEEEPAHEEQEKEEKPDIQYHEFNYSSDGESAELAEEFREEEPEQEEPYEAAAEDSGYENAGSGYQSRYAQEDEEDLFTSNEEDLSKGELNPYTGHEYESNSVRMHPSRIGYVQVYDRGKHQWTDMTEWAFLGYQERKKALLGKDYEPPIYLD